MLITAQKRMGRDAFYCIHDTSQQQLQWKECDKEFEPAQVDTDGNNRRCCHKQDAWGVNTGCCHMWDWASVCLCERKSQGVNLLSAPRTWKKTTFSHVGIMSLWLQRRENLISYTRHSDARLRRGRIPLMGVVEFELFPGVCVFSHIFCVCVLFLLRVRGFPCWFPDWTSLSQVFCRRQRQR